MAAGHLISDAVKLDQSMKLSPSCFSDGIKFQCFIQKCVFGLIKKQKNKNITPTIIWILHQRFSEVQMVSSVLFREKRFPLVRLPWVPLLLPSDWAQYYMPHPGVMW